MKWATLDQIVHSALMRKSFPVHFYLQFLKYASDGLREFHFDTLKTVNTKKLTLNSYNAMELPCDCVDFVRITDAVGQFTRPMSSNESINRLNNYDSSGKKVLYGGVNWGYNGYYGDWNSNSGGSFKVLKERGEIQFLEPSIAPFAILEYISDGSDPDNATKVDPYAQNAIESYIFWQYKEHSRSYSEGEKERAKGQYDDAYRNLRARMNDMTIEDVREAISKGYALYPGPTSIIRNAASISSGSNEDQWIQTQW